MKHILRYFCMLFMLSIILISCDGNVFVKPDITAGVESTVDGVTANLSKSSSFILEPKDFKSFKLTVKEYFKLEDGNYVMPEPELDALLNNIIPEDFTLQVDLKNIPKIDEDTMHALLILESPQDIAIVNKILSVPLSADKEGNAATAIEALYERVIKPLKGENVNGKDTGLIQIGDAISLPTSDYSNLTFGDYIAAQMIVSLIFEKIPVSIVNNYINFKPIDETKKLDEYVAKLGDNMVKALIIDNSAIMHVVSIYTFLNKYNDATTIIDMRKLGTFFNVEEEV